MNRRSFLQALGLSAVAVALPDPVRLTGGEHRGQWRVIELDWSTAEAKRKFRQYGV